MIDAHVYSVPEELHAQSPLIAEEESVLASLHHHPEGAYALSLSTRDAIAKSMEEAGIRGSALVSLPWQSEDLCRRNNDHVLTAAQDGDTFFAICSIQTKSPGWLAEADRVRTAGAVGIKINTGWQGGRLDSPAVRDVAEYVREYDMFLMTHVDHGFRHSETGPANLHSLATMCPHTKIVAAHLGGLLGLYALHPPVAESLKNVWFDTAVSGTLDMVSYYVQAGLGSRLLFGSDFPFNHSHSQVQVVDGIRKIGLGEDVAAAIMEGNFLRLIGKEDGERWS